MVYETWEEAAEQSRTKRAVTSLIVRHNGKTHKAELIKAPDRDGAIVYRHSAVKIRDATPSEVAAARNWRPV